MKKLAKALTLCMIGATTLVSAWNPCCWDGCFSVGAEALWWEPCTCNYEYASRLDLNLAASVQGDVVHIESVKPSYDWGFRIFAGYDTDCYFARLSWTYLKPNATSDVSLSGLQGETLVPALMRINPTNIVIGRVVGRLKHRYDNVVLRGGYYLHKTCDFTFYTFAGGRYVQIEQMRHIEAFDANDQTISQRVSAKFSGGAVEVGLGGTYDLGCCFGLVGHVAGVALIGDRQLSASVDSPIGGYIPLQVDYRSSTHCLPGFELRIGIDYSRRCGCLDLTGEFGYQIDYYLDALSVVDTNFDQTANQVTNLFTRSTDVGFGGLYFGLRACF